MEDDSEGPVQLSFTVNQNTATLAPIDAATETALSAARNPDAEVDMSENDVDTIVLTAATVEKLVEKLTDGASQTGLLSFKLKNLTAVLDETALKAIQAQNNGADTTLRFVGITEDGLNDAQKAALADAELLGGVNASAEADGSPIHSFEGGRVTLTVPVKNGEGENVSIFFLGDEGTLARHATTVEKGIVRGIGDGEFAPLSEITREQLAVMLYNYAQYKGYRTDKTATLARFKDADEVSDWAKAAMKWSVNEKLFTGTDQQMLEPKAGATRAQAAKVFTDFREDFEL